jgi:hypothetical protein
MSLKALAREALERNAPCNSARNSSNLRATRPATTETAAATLAEEIAERAAIIEEDADVPTEWAEGYARLCLAPVPISVSPIAWKAVLNGAGRFLDRWGTIADRLGWTAAELFSVHPNAPLNRRDCRGAALFLERGEVIAITADELTFRVDGVVQRLPRQPTSALPAWEALA